MSFISRCFLPGCWWVDVQLLRMGEGRWFVLDGVELEARQVAVFDEKEHSGTRIANSRRDEHAILHRRAGGPRDRLDAEIYRGASALATVGYDGGRNLGAQFFTTGEVLRQHGQRHGLFLSRHTAISRGHVIYGMRAESAKNRRNRCCRYFRGQKTESDPPA
jgi:hypothetical protein